MSKLKQKNLKTQAIKLKTQAKNSMVWQIHLVELPKTGPISKSDIDAYVSA